MESLDACSNIGNQDIALLQIDKYPIFVYRCMAKLVSILIAVLILVQSFNIPVKDIIELDDLIAHARFHSQEYGDNFVVFLSKHYGELKKEHNQQHQEEQQEHEKLPFQHQCQNAALSAFVLNVAPMETLNVISIGLHLESEYYYQANYSSLEREGPFQPPRQA